MYNYFNFVHYKNHLWLLQLLQDLVRFINFYNLVRSITTSGHSFGEKVINVTMLINTTCSSLGCLTPSSFCFTNSSTVCQIYWVYFIKYFRGKLLLGQVKFYFDIFRENLLLDHVSQCVLLGNWLTCKTKDITVH